MPERSTANPEAGVRRILVPTDFSPGAEPALRWAAELAQAFGAEVVLLHVLELRLAAVTGFPPNMAAMRALDELVHSASVEAEQQMRALAERFPGAKTIIVEGAPRSIILEVAKAEGVDLIVMGTHGRTGLAHLLFGSVAEHVVRDSRVPVLTARQERAV